MYSSAVLLEDRVGIVSGVGPGIGREVVLALAREGANVVLGARTEDRLREVANEVEALGRKAVWLATDITAEAALRHIPTSAEVADAVVFFASDLSRVITGQSLDVNAGSWLA